MMRRMMHTLTTLLCAALLGMIACGGKEADRGAAPLDTQPSSTPSDVPPEAPAPAEPADGEAAPPPAEPDGTSQGAPMTPDECRAAGGTFVASTGSEPTCPDGKKSIGGVRFGIEGGLCCK
jgi:hypothetical protein